MSKFREAITGTLRVFGASAEESRPAPGPLDDYWYGSAGGRSVTGRSITDESALGSTALYRAVDLISDRMAALPINIYIKRPDGSRDYFNQHPLGEVLRYQPNRWQTAFDFWKMMIAILQMRGAARAEIIAGPRGAVDQLVPLHPDRLKTDLLTNGNVRYTYLDPLTNQNRYLAQDEVFSLQGLTIRERAAVTMGPVNLHKDAIALALALEEHGGRLFGNGARPSGILTTDKTLSPDSRAALKESWRKVAVGLSNVGATPVLDNGLKFEAISLKADDAQFIESRGYQLSEIAMMFGVPPILLGASEKISSWGTGIAEVIQGFVNFKLQPMAFGIQQAIRRDLITAPNLYEAEFDFEGLLAGDVKTQWTNMNVAVSSRILTINEARENLGYNRTKDPVGDKHENANTSAPDSAPKAPPASDPNQEAQP